MLGFASESSQLSPASFRLWISVQPALRSGRGPTNRAQVCASQETGGHGRSEQPGPETHQPVPRCSKDHDSLCRKASQKVVGLPFRSLAAAQQSRQNLDSQPQPRARKEVAAAARPSARQAPAQGLQSFRHTCSPCSTGLRPRNKTTLSPLRDC